MQRLYEIIALVLFLLLLSALAGGCGQTQCAWRINNQDGIIESAEDLRFDVVNIQNVPEAPGFYYSAGAFQAWSDIIVNYDPGPQLPWYWPSVWHPEKWQAMMDKQLGKL